MKQPLIAIRTKASPNIGFGHLRRCMTLARALKKQGAASHLIINPDPVAERLLKDSRINYSCVEAEDEKDLHATVDFIEKNNLHALVVDTYDIDTCVLDGKIKVPVILVEDHIHKPFYADIFLNPAMHVDDVAKHKRLNTQYLTGLDYLLLDEIFHSSVVVDRKPRKEVHRILLTLGGGDPFSLSTKLISWIRDVLPAATIDVVVGPFFGEALKKELLELDIREEKIVLHQHLSSLYQLMMECDLAVTGAGQTTYELAATGTPALVIQLADNQAANLKTLIEKETIIFAGKAQDVELDQKVKTLLSSLAADWEKRSHISKQGPRAVDGKGAVRVASKMLELID